MLEIQTSDTIESPWTAWFIYGPMGSGKTRAVSSFPRPLFLIPANEGSELTLAQLKDKKLDFIRIGKRPDGTVVPARAHLSEVLTELEKRHAQMRSLLAQAAKAEDETERERFYAEADKAFPWQTVALESLSHYSDMLVEDVSDHGRKKMDQQGWGVIGSYLRTVHSRLRNFDAHIVYTSLPKTQEKEEGGIVSGGPNLIGQAAEKFPAMCDVVVYMEELPGTGKDAKPTYRAFFRRYRWWQARTRFGGFPDYVDNFNFAELEPKIIGAVAAK
jgi:hypothetical protein